MMFLIIALFSVWTLLTWIGGWKARGVWERHCRLSERFARYVPKRDELLPQYGELLPNPAQVARDEMQAFWN